LDPGGGISWLIGGPSGGNRVDRFILAGLPAKKHSETLEQLIQINVW